MLSRWCTASPIVQFAPFIIIFLFLFPHDPPSKEEDGEEQKLLANLQKGDEIYTKSGVLGKITGITDKVVTLDIDEGSKLKVLRAKLVVYPQKSLRLRLKKINNHYACSVFFLGA